MEDRCNINIKQYDVHLNSKSQKKAGNMTMYEYKNGRRE